MYVEKGKRDGYNAERNQKRRNPSESPKEDRQISGIMFDSSKSDIFEYCE